MDINHIFYHQHRATVNSNKIAFRSGTRTKAHSPAWSEAKGKLTVEQYPAFIKNVFLLLCLQYVHFLHLLEGEHFHGVTLAMFHQQHSAKSPDANCCQCLQVSEIDICILWGREGAAIQLCMLNKETNNWFNHNKCTHLVRPPSPGRTAEFADSPSVAAHKSGPYRRNPSREAPRGPRCAAWTTPDQGWGTPRLATWR